VVVVAAVAVLSPQWRDGKLPINHKPIRKMEAGFAPAFFHSPLSIDAHWMPP